MGGLVRLLRRQPVHILHTHLFGSNTWGRVLGRLAGVPMVIAHEHWSTKSGREAQIDHVLYRLSDRVLVPSEESKRVVMSSDRIPAERISVIYNGVDIAKFGDMYDTDETRRELGVQPGTRLIGYVGRLTHEKGGQDLLVRAVARARQGGRDVRLVVVGDGPMRADLEALAANLGEPVIFTGLRADVARLLAAMDIFVLPSLHEALPIAALEAMATGLPVIATSVGGTPEVVRDGESGLLVPASDEEGLYEAIIRMLDDQGLAERLAMAGRERVRADFTLDGMARKVEAVYEELAASKLGRVQAMGVAGTPFKQGN
jgi:glycosyltransferase involved in cell wall biosynthesis